MTLAKFILNCYHGLMWLLIIAVVITMIIFVWPLVAGLAVAGGLTWLYGWANRRAEEEDKVKEEMERQEAEIFYQKFLEEATRRREKKYG